MAEKDYCTHLLKYYVGNMGTTTAPKNGKDYIYSCRKLGEKGRTVRANPYKATETFCKNCPHFSSRNKQMKIANEINNAIRRKMGLPERKL